MDVKVKTKQTLDLAIHAPDEKPRFDEVGQTEKSVDDATRSVPRLQDSAEQGEDERE